MPAQAEATYCEQIADLVPALIDAGEPAPAEVVEHVETCLRCQADLAQYRRVLRALHHMRTEVLEPAPGTLSGILANIEARGERRAIRSMLTGRKAAYIGGIAAATAAAGAAGAIVLARRGTLRRAS